MAAQRRKPPQNTPAAQALAEACGLAARREYAKAAERFEKARGESPGFPALCGQALCQYKMGRLKEALELARRAAEAAPERGEPHFISGLAYKDAGRYDDAIRSLDRARETGYRLSAALYHRGAAHFLDGRLAEAERDFEQAARAQPQSAAAFYNLGVVRVHRSRWREAVEAFSTCARIDAAGAAYYHEIIFAIGRAQAGEEFHFRAHRIKNMLALLSDTCRKALQQAPLGSGGPDLARVGERLEKVLAEMSELLSFVRQEPLELDVWDVHDVVETALLRAADSLSTVRVEKLFGPNVPGVVCDANSLSEAFLNIIINAAEAMGAGGTLTIRTRWPDGGVIRVEFEDTGGGVKAEPPEKVFQFAFTTKPGGTGLGLCQAQRAVGEHGGRILIEEGAEGARFVVELPLGPGIGERIQEIGLRPDLSDDIGFLSARGADISFQPTGGG